MFALAGRVAARVAEELERPVTLGAGRAVAAADARRSYHEARCTLEAVALGSAPRGLARRCATGSPAPTAAPPRAGLRAGTTGTRVATYKDLGSFQLLLSLQDDEA